MLLEEEKWIELKLRRQGFQRRNGSRKDSVEWCASRLSDRLEVGFVDGEISVKWIEEAGSIELIMQRLFKTCHAAMKKRLRSIYGM